MSAWFACVIVRRLNHRCTSVLFPILNACYMSFKFCRDSGRVQILQDEFSTFNVKTTQVTHKKSHRE